MWSEMGVGRGNNAKPQVTKGHVPLPPSPAEPSAPPPPAAATSLPEMAGCCEHTRSKASGIVARPKKAWERPLKVWTSLWCGRAGERGAHLTNGRQVWRQLWHRGTEEAGFEPAQGGTPRIDWCHLCHLLARPHQMMQHFAPPHLGSMSRC